MLNKAIHPATEIQKYILHFFTLCLITRDVFSFLRFREKYLCILRAFAALREMYLFLRFCGSIVFEHWDIYSQKITEKITTSSTHPKKIYPNGRYQSHQECRIAFTGRQLCPGQILDGVSAAKSGNPDRHARLV